MGVSPKTVHVWLADPDGSVARERKRRYHDGVCRDCGDPCYRYWSHWQGGHTAWRCQKCERRRLHEQRKWTKTKGQGGARAVGRRSRPATDRAGDRAARHPRGVPCDPARARRLQHGAQSRRAAPAAPWPASRKRLAKRQRGPARRARSATRTIRSADVGDDADDDEWPKTNAQRHREAREARS